MEFGTNKLGYVTENRKEEGLVLPFSVSDNLTLTALGRLQNRLMKLSNAKGRQMRAAMIGRMKIKKPSQWVPVES